MVYLYLAMIYIRLNYRTSMRLYFLELKTTRFYRGFTPAASRQVPATWFSFKGWVMMSINESWSLKQISCHLSWDRYIHLDLVDFCLVNVGKCTFTWMVWELNLWKWTARPWKMMVGRLNFLFGKVTFHGGSCFRGKPPLFCFRGTHFDTAPLLSSETNKCLFGLLFSSGD